MPVGKFSAGGNVAKVAFKIVNTVIRTDVNRDTPAGNTKAGIDLHLAFFKARLGEDRGDRNQQNEHYKKFLHLCLSFVFLLDRLIHRICPIRGSAVCAHLD